MTAYVIHYQRWTEEGDNRAGWSGMKDFVQFCENVLEYQKWMDDTDHMRKANYGRRAMILKKIETYTLNAELDTSIANAESATRVDKKLREIKKAQLLKEREELDKQINEL